MATYVIGLIIALALCYAAKTMFKHFRGEGGCCGGGSDTIVPMPKKQLEGDIIGHKTMNIAGMTCINCKTRVEKLLNKIDGASAAVDLKQGTADLTMTRQISNEEIFKALKGSGYTASNIA